MAKLDRKFLIREHFRLVHEFLAVDGGADLAAVLEREFGAKVDVRDVTGRAWADFDDEMLARDGFIVDVLDLFSVLGGFGGAAEEVKGVRA